MTQAETESKSRTVAGSGAGSRRTAGRLAQGSTSGAALDQEFALAQQIVALVAHLLREEEQRELFSEAYDALMKGLKRYEEKADRRMRRIHPN